MHSLAIIFLITSLVAIPLMAKRTNIWPLMAEPVMLNRPQQSQQSSTAAKNEIVAKLNALLQDTVLNDEWYVTANDLIVDLVPLDKTLSIEYLKKIQAKAANSAAEKAYSEAISDKAVGATTEDITKSPQPIAASPSVPMPQVIPVSAEQNTISETFPVTSESKNIADTVSLQLPKPALQEDEIIQELDEKLRSTVIDDAWYEHVNNLVFDLALFNRSASQAYLKKIRSKINLASALQSSPPIVEPEKKEISAMPVPEEPSAPSSSVGQSMKRGTPPAPPAMKKGTPPPPPSAGGLMKKGTPAAPPSVGAKKGGSATPPPPPGPMVKGKKTSVPQGKTSPATPAAVKGPEPLSITISYGGPQLAKRSNEEIIELFNNLLEALAIRGDFWDAVKKEPMPEWRNRIDTVKKAIADPKRNLTINAAPIIENRIKQVRAEKAQQGLQKQESAEKEKQKIEMPEFTQEELIVQINGLKKRTDPSDFKWLIEFQGSIKKLDKINHDKAVEYEAEFIKNFPGQKQFLPKKKEAVVVKELTEEEKLIAAIDTILNEKPILWAIKAREPIQLLYDMNPVKGFEYQEKYLAATQQATGKTDKPFLKMKE